ncbi:hypothetical protein C6B38_02425 [Spiroplasma sp. ChiS]|uniref:hypothetical protein n=1 Tax=Spiroplasma sp. ChiS TaxID=2099885 RepID=UPI000CF9D7F3|nr:hypothetical protein [Spiroplasma sp. ChiS]PQP79115.1 hypothetical protein C6B38_02425 [Spiroplasma sp. ChiS]
MKKLLSLIGTGMLAVSAVAPLVANTTYEPKTEEVISSEDKVEIIQEKNEKLSNVNRKNFNLTNLVKSEKTIISSTIDSAGNIYWATFDNESITLPGEKIWKYNINTKEKKVVWKNKNFKVDSFQLAVDNRKNFYLGSSGGVIILNNESQAQQMPLVEGKTNCIFVKENIVYVSTMDGLYKYDIENKKTGKIILPNNLIIDTIYFDEKNNLYFGIYKSDFAGGYVLKNGKNNIEPILGNKDFNKDITYQIIEINSDQIYFNVFSTSEKNKLFKIFLGKENKTNYLITIPRNSFIFKIDNKETGLLSEEKNNIKISILEENKFIKELYKFNSISFSKFHINKFIYLINNNNINLISW